MNRYRILFFPCLVALAAGCVSRGEHDAVKQQMDTCERDKVAAQSASRDCEARYQAANDRWQNIETQLTSTLPQTLQDFRDERDKIIELVPQQVRDEVAGKLDRYFGTVAREFKKMDSKLDTLNEQVTRSHSQMTDLVKDSTQAVDVKLTETHQAVIAERSRRQDRSRRIASVISEIAWFDQERINCKKCKDRLRFKGDSQAQLLAFHSKLIQDIQALQASEADAGSGSVETGALPTRALEN